MEETITSSREPGLTKAGMSAVTMTMATFFEEMLCAGTVIP